MRLLNAKTLQLEDFVGDENVPKYAILSHTWGKDEISLQTWNNKDKETKGGFAKIKYCCDQAIRDNLEWTWIDTCCIDKSSSAELSEAINSMFRWYQNAVVCYAYLFDVPGHVNPAEDRSELVVSRWFKRGWTLQELLAPKNLIFFSSTWKRIGTKEELYQPLADITGIEAETLQGEDLQAVSVATRMSWAATRETTRTEDMAYCLLGIFDINMPLLYGEGKRAFFRLQEEILKANSDQSIFAWGTSPIIKVEQFLDDEMNKLVNQSSEDLVIDSRFGGLLADSPADFKHSQHIDALAHWRLEKDGFKPKPPVIYNRGIHVELPVVEILCDPPKNERRPPILNRVAKKTFEFAVLGCRIRKGYAVDEYNLLGVPIDFVGYDRSGVRYRKLVTVSKPRYGLEPEAALQAKLRPLNLASLSTVLRDIEHLDHGLANYASHPIFPTSASGYSLAKVHCAPSTKFDRRNGIIWCDTTWDGVEAMFFFKCHLTGGAFAIALQSRPRWFTFEGDEKVMAERIFVHAKMLPEEFEVLPEPFKEIRKREAGWQSLRERDNFYPARHCEESGRMMRIPLADFREAVVTTRWFRWGNRKGWQEELNVDVVDMVRQRSPRQPVQQQMLPIRSNDKGVDRRMSRDGRHAKPNIANMNYQ
ncbi:HET-domain-containing protein [Acephala macrosclerotiorum]|nr:HET-domain-containing protein [Acephala macrosclerotiorum]